MEKNTILVIEDDNDINDIISKSLEDEGYNVFSAFSGTEAIIYIDNKEVDLVILDLMIPGKSGEEVLDIIRKSKDMPIIILSAKEEIGIKGKLLRAGADDFLSKPFDIDELLARVIANLRRYEIKPLASELFYKEVYVDEESMVVKISEKEVRLTQTEYQILNLLIKNPNKVFSKDNLCTSVWKEDFIDDNTITVHISNLRNKLKKSGAKENYIKTIWGIGYKLNAD